MSEHGKVLALQRDLNGALKEREGAIEAALLALLTGEHVVFLGPPGTAKSLLVRSICERIDGATYFERLLTKFSTPEELFGPLSLSALEQDQYRRVVDGTILRVEVAFVDEVFKANSAILNALLTIMNERLYHEGSGAVQAPLLSLFGASNELPEDASLGALYDRFLLRVTVPYLVEDDSLRAIWKRSVAPAPQKITIDELRSAQDEVENVTVTDATLDTILAVKHGLEAEGIAVSDRRWVKVIALVKARAWLEGESETCADHCEVLVDALWSEPDQRRVVERCVSKVCNPLNLEAVELEDAAKDLFDQKPAPETENLVQALEPLLRQLGDIVVRLKARIESAPEHRRARAVQALARVQGWHRELSKVALRSMSRLHLAPGA